MPVEINPSQVQIQQLDVNINGPDDINTMFVINGQATMNIGAQTNTTNQNVSREETFKIKLEPKIKNTEFRRAIGTANLSNVILNDREDTTVNAFESVTWQLTEVDADYDDESEQVELRVSIRVSASGESTSVNVRGFGFSVTTLASMTNDS